MKIVENGVMLRLTRREFSNLALAFGFFGSARAAQPVVARRSHPVRRARWQDADRL